MLRWGCLAICASAFFLLPGENAVASSDCDDIVVANMNWSSAEIIAEIDKLILSSGFGCTVQFSNGDPLASFQSMKDSGTPHIFPELWLRSVGSELYELVDGGFGLIAGDVLADGGEEGWWIPQYIADEYPDIRTVEEALRHPELFPNPDDDSSGAVYNCPAGWDCEIPNSNLFKANLAGGKGFTLLETGSAAELDASIAKAYADRTGWLGYYWSPSALLGRYDMVRLSSVEHDPDHWRECTQLVECPDAKENDWPSSRVVSLVSDDFASKSDELGDYVSSRHFDNKTMNELLGWAGDSQATGQEAAIYFLTHYQEIWTAWVPDEVELRILTELPSS